MPYDLAGASSKNRFRLEMIWGICKVFDLFDQSDFCVVFDYKCDIEIHFENSLEFYQLKTHKVQKPYSFSKIATRCVLQDLSTQYCKEKVHTFAPEIFL